MHPFSIPLTHPFRISLGQVTQKDGLIFEVRSGDFVGWGEVAVDGIPFYTAETVGSAIDVASRVLIPLAQSRAWSHPDELADAFAAVRGNAFAMAAIDAAAWDIWGKMNNTPVWKLLGGVREMVECGPSIGILPSPADAVREVERHLASGLRRMKLKVCPGFDTQYIAAIRKAYPEVALMVDANNAYGIDQFETIAAWDSFGLLMIEQPLDEHDIYFHSRLRQMVRTPVCLDESIHTLHDARCAAELGAADIINIKVGRVAGLTWARRVHDFCRSRGIVNWIGSRMGTGVADAMRLAAASLENCSLPSDLGFAADYMPDDVLAVPLKRVDGRFFVQPTSPGLGIEIDRDKLKHYRADR